MKFKLALNHRGLCETAYIEADWSTYREIGTSLVAQQFSDAAEPDFFAWDQTRDGWYKVAKSESFTTQEFCAADYCDSWSGTELEAE